MMKNNFLIVFLLITACACSNKTELNPTILIKPIQQLNSNEYFCFDNLANDVSVVELQSSSGKYISAIKRLCITKDSDILILNGSTVIYDFDRNGNLQKVIGAIGKGPGEYLEAKDFCLSQNESFVNVLTRHSIDIFETDNGKFVHKIDITPFRKSDYLPEFIANDGKDGFFIWASNPSKVTDFSKDFFCLWHIDKKGKVLSKQLERTEFELELNRFTNSCDGGFWIRPLGGTSNVFKLHSGKVFSEISIDFEGQFIPEHYFEQFSGEPYLYLDKWIYSNYYKMPYEIYDNSNYIFFLFGGPQGQTYSCIYNKNKSSAKAKKLNNGNPNMCYSDSTYFYAYYDPSSSDINKMDSVFSSRIDNQIKNENFHLFKFRINEE